MKETTITHPHGYLLDSDGNVCKLFGNWQIGTHTVPDHVESVEYVDGPAAHDVDIHDDYLTERS